MSNRRGSTSPDRRIVMALGSAVLFGVVAPVPGALVYSASKGFGMDALLIVFFSWLIWGPAAFVTGLVAGLASRLRPSLLLLLCTLVGALAFWAIDLFHDWLPMPALYGAIGSLVAGTMLVSKRLVASIEAQSLPG